MSCTSGWPRWNDGPNDAPFNRIEGTGERGIVAAGFVYRKLLDILGDDLRADLRLLKLGVLYPLPRDVVSRFLAGCREVLVLEENEPYVETQIKAVAHDSGATRAHRRQADRAHAPRG